MIMDLRYGTERYPLLGIHDLEPQPRKNLLRKGIAGILLILLIGASVLLITSPNSESTANTMDAPGKLQSSSSSGQQPQQPQQKDQWLVKRFAKEYDEFVGEADTVDKDKDKESHEKQYPSEKQQDQQNASAIIDSVSKLLDTVGKNFTPIRDLRKIMELDLMARSNKTGIEPGKLRSGSANMTTTMTKMSTKELLMKMRSELDQMREKLDLGISHFVNELTDQKVEKDIGRIIDHMKEGGCPLYGVFSMINVVADMLATSGYESLDQEADLAPGSDDKAIDFSFPSAVKHRLMRQERAKNKNRDKKSGVARGKLQKFYGLPPESIMNAYMPGSVVDTLMEKNVNKTAASAGKLKATSPDSSGSIAKDWGSFGQQIQQDFLDINKDHMKNTAIGK